MIPTSEAELANLIAHASGPLDIRGGGTRPIGAPVVGEVMHTSGLSGISLYEPGALTLVAQAGTPLSLIEETLAAEGQMLSFEPPDFADLFGRSGQSTIGGVVATNASGPRRIQAGACRDLLLGVRFVDGRGDVLQNGGRVMKNVTGYDLAKLLCGSYGTLGVLTEVSLKVLPKPEACSVLLIEGLDDEAAISTLSRALGAPFDVTGAAHIPVGLDGHPVTMIRLEGFEKSVRYRANALRDMLSQRAGGIAIESDPDRTSAGWSWVRDVAALRASSGDLWRVSVKPSDGPKLVQAWREAGIAVQVIYDWGGGLIWALVPEAFDLRSVSLTGHATRVRGSGGTPVFHPQSPPLMAIERDLRKKFDPRNILNPGKMG